MNVEMLEGSQMERHPGDVFYEKLGLPEDFGDAVMTYHGREIRRRDYFFQPDLNPDASHAYQVLSAMDINDPNFPKFRDAFVAAAQHYLGIE